MWPEPAGVSGHDRLLYTTVRDAIHGAEMTLCKVACSQVATGM
jgi:hypothetical protein